VARYEYLRKAVTSAAKSRTPKHPFRVICVGGFDPLRSRSVAGWARDVGRTRVSLYEFGASGDTSAAVADIRRSAEKRRCVFDVLVHSGDLLDDLDKHLGDVRQVDLAIVAAAGKEDNLLASVWNVLARVLNGESRLLLYGASEGFLRRLRDCPGMQLDVVS